MTLIYLLSIAFAEPWSSSGERFYLSNDQISDDTTIQLLYSFTAQGELMLGAMMNRQATIVIDARCTAKNSSQFSCDYLGVEDEVITTKDFTYDSKSESITQTDTNMKACRVSGEVALQVTSGATTRGCHSQVAPQQQVSTEKPSGIEAEIRSIAAKEYPNDKDMQDYIYKKQMTAHRYMSSVSDKEVKGIALQEYPADYSMQKYVFDKQASDKRYMAALTDHEVKGIALGEYPLDYSMQKYVYDKQLSAKQYMNAQTDSPKKRAAIAEYPNDYSMQQYLYDRE
tara:strand:+ start:48 stop:899 length:852 start_codon:yes stop_codon:yes gene_type:complete